MNTTNVKLNKTRATMNTAKTKYQSRPAPCDTVRISFGRDRILALAVFRLELALVGVALAPFMRALALFI